MTLSSFDLFNQEELKEIIDCFNTVYNVIINPLNINDDIISTRVLNIFKDLNLIDMKRENYYINSENYLNFISGLGALKQEFELKSISDILNKSSNELKDETFASIVDSKLISLRKVYETLILHQKQEKNQNKDLKERAEKQIQLAIDYIKKENEKVDKLISDNSSFLKKVEETKSNVSNFLKKIKELKDGIKNDNSKFCKILIYLVECYYYNQKFYDLNNRIEEILKISEGFLNIKLLF